MQLEDHSGDVLGKSRRSFGVSAIEAARWAGISEVELDAWESEGKVPARVDYFALCRPLDLNPEKLEALAAGWRPANVRLDRWHGLEMVTTNGHGMEVNAFLIWDPETREAAAFDTGWNALPLREIIKTKELQLTHLLITHSHRDHVADVAGLHSAFPGMMTLGAHLEWNSPPFEIPLKIGRLKIQALATPGHAEDGVTYVIRGWHPDAPPVAVVGDVLFAGSMGGAREDLALAKERAREHILSLPGDSLICPGHGPVTTVTEQLEINPFF